QVQAHRNADWLSAIILCEKSRECEIWECKKNGEVKLVNQVYESCSIYQTLEESLNFEDDTNCVWLVERNEFIENNEFVVNGSIVVEVKIVVQKAFFNRFLLSIKIFECRSGC
ncbi:hypothetical protein PENTCL1PPCAC_23282, partial [Pristionchus entomophagus]